MNKILILSGGGTKCLALFIVLDEIQKITGKNIAQIFSSVHTSSGSSIAASYFVQGKDKDKDGDYLHYFSTMSENIFRTNICTKIMNKLYCGKGNSKYSVQNLEYNLKTTFGNINLKELNTNITITAMNNFNSSSVYFNSSGYPDLKLTDAILSTVAAPTYFPPYKLGKMHYIDPGYYCNVPINSAISEITNKKLNVHSNTQVYIVNLNQHLPSNELCNTHFSFLQSYLERVNESTRKDGMRNIKNLLGKNNVHELSINFERQIPIDSFSDEDFNYIKSVAYTSILNDNEFFQSLAGVCSEINDF